METTIVSKIKRYNTYKDSGVEWLGEIPEHWEVKRLKFIFEEIQTGSTPSTSNQKFYGGNIDWYTPKDLDNDELIFAEKKLNQLAIKEGEVKFFPEDSILIVGIGATAGKTSYLINKGTFNQQITGFHSHKVNNKYFFYLFFSLSDVMLNTANYTTLAILNNEFFKVFSLVKPPLSEQTAIAKFLDDKTEKIDQAISIKEQQIALLKEHKQILIHKAVTRGLDDSVPLKDSGVEWIGEIPEHWDLLPGFMVFQECKTKNIGMKEDVVLSLSYGKIIIRPKEKLFGLVPESFETYQIVKPGDIIIRVMDLQNDKTSLRTGIAENDGIITSAYLNLNIVRNNIPEYIYNFLHSLDVTKVLYKFGSGLRQNLSFLDFKHMSIPIPPISEQKEISEYIESASQKIDTAISLKTQEIEKLKEYKSSLINSVVTGKVKVS